MTVRFVVLGCGRIGTMHAEYLHRRVSGAEVVGVFDVFGDSAVAVATELGVPAVGSLEDALSLDADAVAICTSTDTHVDCMVAAARAGRAIFCEKPISLDVAEVDRGLRAVEAAGVPLHIGFNRRFDPSHRSVAEAVARGAVGDVEVTLVHTPGHTPGSQCFLVDGRLVAGDTLFLDGCGRTDLPGSDASAMMESLRMLSTVPDDVILYPGHRYSLASSATMGAVKQSNFVFQH